MRKVTTDFAIEYLLDDCDDCPEKADDNECISQSHCFEVKRMAIQALKQMDALDKITVELKSVKEKWWYGVDNDCFMKLSDVLQIIDKYKAESEEE